MSEQTIIVSEDAEKIHAAAAELAPFAVANTANNHQAAAGMVVQMRNRCFKGDFVASESEMHGAAMEALEKLRPTAVYALSQSPASSEEAKMDIPSGIPEPETP
jgi:hypothetical protein